MIVVFPNLGQVADDIQQALAQHRRECLMSLGATLAHLAGMDYIAKARGGTGVDGVKWDELARSTIAARVRAHGEGKNIVKQRRDLTKKILKLMGTRRAAHWKRQAKAKKARQRKAVSDFKKYQRRKKQGLAEKQRKKRTATVSPKPRKQAASRQKSGNSKSDQIRALRQKRRELLVRLNALVDAAMQNHEIGVDSGLQRSCLGPGLKVTPKNIESGGIFDPDPTGITVGYGRSYSGFFDEHRKLLPETLPDPWMHDLEKVASEWGADIVERRLGG